MKKTIRISRPSSGTGTVVTVTLVRNGITSSFAYKTTGSAIKTAVRVATNEALSMLDQAQEEVDAEAQG